MNKIKMPKGVTEIITILKKNNFEAYAVGGCVRDTLLGLTPNDWDITTSAQPKQVKSLFSKTVDTGLEHGTVTVVLDRDAFEVTTYRIDGEYYNHRKPESVEYTSDLKKDLERRDFTINAMAMNEEEGVIDVFGGKEDLKHGLIRCVGDANERFKEDALRMLRAIRFSAQLGFEIHEDTVVAIRENASLIQKISAERIHVELTKTLVSENPEFIKKLDMYGLMKFIIPEFIPNINLDQQNPYHVYTVDQHTYRCITHIAPEESLRWTMFLHDIGKGYTKTVDELGIGHFKGHVEKSLELSKKILKRLKFDNKTRDEIIALITYHDHHIYQPTLKKIRKMVSKIGKELFPKYIQVMRADVLGQNPKLSEERLRILDQALDYYQEILDKDQCTQVKELAINGNDLIQLGIGEGKKIGFILSFLLEVVLEQPELNKKEYLLKKALEIK